MRITLDTIKAEAQEAEAEASRELLISALIKHKGHVGQTADAIGAGREDIYRKATRWGVDLAKARAAITLGETDLAKIMKVART